MGGTNKADGSDLKLSGDFGGQPCRGGVWGGRSGLTPLMLHPDGGSGRPGGLPACVGLAAGVPFLVAGVATTRGQAAEAAPRRPAVVSQEGGHAGELGGGVLRAAAQGRGETPPTPTTGSAPGECAHAPAKPRHPRVGTHVDLMHGVHMGVAMRRACTHGCAPRTGTPTTHMHP